MIRYTKQRSVYSIDDIQPVEVTWEEFVREFSSHLSLPDKDKAPGFGPYVMSPTPRPCPRHRGGPRHDIHRCDDCVDLMTLAVFDVDQGTEDEVFECHNRLAKINAAHLFYSTHSHTESTPAYRLIIPLAAPLPAEDWRGFRTALLREFLIPADPVACSGVSHFYFVPSCKPGAPFEVSSVDGLPLDPTSIRYERLSLVTRKEVLAATATWEPAPAPPEPVDLEPLLTKIRNRANGLKRRASSKDNQKGVWLSRCARGEALAQHGERNVATTRVSGMLAWMFPEEPVEILRGLMLPSLRQMQAEGSRIMDTDLDRMLISGLRSKAEADAKEKIIKDQLKEIFQKVKSDQ